VASAERSDSGGKVEVEEDEEKRVAAVEREKQLQREKISRWKVGVHSLDLPSSSLSSSSLCIR